MDVIKVAETLGLNSFFEKGQLLSGPFKSLRIHYTDREQGFSAEIMDEIKKNWDIHLEKHPTDFNGILASIISLKLNNGKVSIKTRKTNFSTFYFLKESRTKNIDIEKTPIDKRNAIPLSIGAIAITVDKKIVVAIRKNTTFDNKKLTFMPGGYIDPLLDAKNGELSAKYCLERELEEELGISDYGRMQYLGIVHSRESSKQPLIAVRLSLLDSSQTISSIYGHNQESYELFFIENKINVMKKFLDDANTQNIAIHDAWKLILHFSDIA